MITVELQRVPAGGHDYARVASLTVSDDGRYQMDDPEGLFPTRLHVLVADGGAGLRRVRLEEDPHTWARNLHTVLRTGYLVPKVTHDDALPEGT